MYRVFKEVIKIIREEGALALTIKSLRFIMRPLAVPYCLFKIRNLNQRGGYDLNKLVDFVSTDRQELIKYAQVRPEILELLIVLDKIKPKSILEIGTLRGGTLFLFSRIASEDATIISVDLPGRPFSDQGYPKWKIPLYKSFASPNQQIHLIRKNSHDEPTLEEVKAILNCRKIDFLFIDGDHTYEGVKKDFEMYSPLVSENGIIAFHDIVPSREVGLEVSAYWSEIKSKYEHVEIIEDWNQNRAGIGMIGICGASYGEHRFVCG